MNLENIRWNNILKPNCHGDGTWLGLQELCRSQRQHTHKWDYLLFNGSPSELPHLFCHIRGSKKMTIYEIGIRCLLDTKFANALILYFLEKKFLLFKLHRLWYFVIETQINWQAQNRASVRTVWIKEYNKIPQTPLTVFLQPAPCPYLMA